MKLEIFLVLTVICAGVVADVAHLGYNYEAEATNNYGTKQADGYHYEAPVGKKAFPQPSPAEPEPEAFDSFDLPLIDSNALNVEATNDAPQGFDTQFAAGQIDTVYAPNGGYIY